MNERESTLGRFGGYLRGMSPKARQYALLGLIGMVFLLLVFGSMSLWDKQSRNLQHDVRPEKANRNITTPGAQVDPRDVWMTQSAQQIKEMDNVVQGLRLKLAEVEQKQAAVPAGKAGNILPELPPMPRPAPDAAGSGVLPQPITEPGVAGQVPRRPSEQGGAPPSLPLPQPLPVPVPAPTPGIAAFEVSEPVQPSTASSDESRGKAYIPAGAFMRAALLGGIDAPTGGQAQNNPWPVLLRIQDNAFLPNRFRARVRECFALGSGYGDISSERAYLRLESFSCVLANGEVIDANVKGYAVGEDGKAGLRGRLVSKQGQILANALMTGVISGIGHGFQQSATTYSTSALGTVGSVEPGKQFQAGVGTGVGKALDRLSQYYITLAEKMFPIIEVDAGRVVDIVLTKGVALGLSARGEEDSYSEVWRRGRQIMKKPLNPLE